jgi:hypothetical protein
MSDQTQTTEQETIEALKSIDNQYQERVEALKGRVNQAFTHDQALLINEIIPAVAELKINNEESVYAYMHLAIVIETFYELLVEKHKILDPKEFNEISEKLLNERLLHMAEQASKPKE